MAGENIDAFSLLLLEQGKRFLEKAKSANDEESASAFCHASLLLGFSALEAHINSVADELLLREGLELHELSILKERETALEDGKFTLTNRLKIYRLEDRLLFIFARFSSDPSPIKSSWWGDLKNGIDIRNRLVHPKQHLKLTHVETSKALFAIIECLNALFKAVFKKPHPSYNRMLDSNMSF